MIIIFILIQIKMLLIIIIMLWSYSVYFDDNDNVGNWYVVDVGVDDISNNDECSYYD